MSRYAVLFSLYRVVDPAIWSEKNTVRVWIKPEIRWVDGYSPVVSETIRKMLMCFFSLSDLSICFREGKAASKSGTPIGCFWFGGERSWRNRICSKVWMDIRE